MLCKLVHILHLLPGDITLKKNTNKPYIFAIACSISFQCFLFSLFQNRFCFPVKKTVHIRVDECLASVMFISPNSGFRINIRSCTDYPVSLNLNQRNVGGGGGGGGLSACVPRVIYAPA